MPMLSKTAAIVMTVSASMRVKPPTAGGCGLTERFVMRNGEFMGRNHRRRCFREADDQNEEPSECDALHKKGWEEHVQPPQDEIRGIAAAPGFQPHWPRFQWTA